MNNKTLTILPILFYSGFASASLYIHQPVVENNSSSTNLRIIFDENTKVSEESKVLVDNNKDLVVSNNDKIKQDQVRKEIADNNTASGFGKEDQVIAINEGKESTYISPNKDTTPKYENIVQSSEYPIVPVVKTIYAKMDKGFLSNSMRQHLDELGWELRWSSGSDRKITVPYVIEHKEGDIVEFVTRISELYNVFIDIYPSNKTIHVSE